MRLINATDLRLDLDQWPEVRYPQTFILLGIGRAWSMYEIAEALLGIKPCPECGGRPLGPRCYCLLCDRSGLDGRVELPGLQVDSCPNQEWIAEMEQQRARGHTRWRGKRA